jgi:hypothetical protein
MDEDEDDFLDEDEMDDDEGNQSSTSTHSRRSTGKGEKRSYNRESSSSSATSSHGVMQPSFQPGASMPTQVCLEKNPTQKYLVWNLIGQAVSTRLDKDNYTVEITLADANKGRPMRLADHHHFTMAALTEEAALLASQGNKDKQIASCLMLRCFHSWTKSDWTFNFPANETVIGNVPDSTTV